jgi:hypothetical protein
MNADLADKDSQDEKQTQNPDLDSPGKKRSKPPKKLVDIKKDVTKTFKKMLTQNHARGTVDTGRNGHDQTNESTKYGGSIGKNGDVDALTEHSNMDIEMKYIRKKMKKNLAQKFYKEDEEEEQNSFTREDKDNLPPILRKNKKDDIRQLQEFITTKRPKDPFKDLDPLTQKVDISKELAYNGTSANDIFN